MSEKILGDLPVLKFGKVGEILKGRYVSMTPSKKFKDSFALTLDNDGNKFVMFISNIQYERLMQYGIEVGETLKFTYKGKTKSKTTGQEYNNIEIAVID